MTEILANPWYWVLLILFLAALIYLVLVHFILRKLFARLARHAGKITMLGVLADRDRPISNWVAGALGVVLAAAAVLISLDVLGINIEPVTSRLAGAGQAIASAGGIILRIAIIIAVAYIVQWAGARMLAPVIRSSLLHGKDGIEMEEAAKRATALSQVGQYVITTVVVLIAVIMIIGLLGFNPTPILAGVGIAGIALGFGAQHLVRDIISGVFILLEDQYRVGDVASVGGKTGLVEGVNLRRTLLRDLDGIVHVVPNGEISVASNFTKSFSRVNLDILVAYKEDLNRVSRVINRVGQELARDEYFGSLILEPPQVLRINSFDEYGIGIKVLGVTRPIRQWEVMGELRRRIKEEFDLEGIEIPFPHRTIYWGVDSHPRAEPGPYTRGVSRTAVEDLESITQPEPWAMEAVDEAAVPEVDGAAARPAVNLMAHLDVVRHLLKSPPTGLFTDIDGTLARIAPSPKLAKITPAAREALGDLSRQMTVSVLTGRDVESARAFLGLTSVIYHGNHGIESWERGSTSVLPEAQASKRQIQRLFKSARSKLGPKVGVLLEDKAVALAFHYRQASDPESAREAIMDFLAQSPDSKDLVVYEGKMVVEVHVPVTSNKGTSLKSVVEGKGLRSALVLGDDHTDVDSFKVLAQLRREGVLQGVCVAVLGSNTPPDLLGVADYTLADTESVEVFLMWLARELSRL